MRNAPQAQDPELRRQLDGYGLNLQKTASGNRLVVHYFGDDALRVLGRARDTARPSPAP
jgi:hypothetical protein